MPNSSARKWPITWVCFCLLVDTCRSVWWWLHHWLLYLFFHPAKWGVQADSRRPESAKDLIQVSCVQLHVKVKYSMFLNRPVFELHAYVAIVRYGFLHVLVIKTRMEIKCLFCHSLIPVLTLAECREMLEKGNIRIDTMQNKTTSEFIFFWRTWRSRMSNFSAPPVLFRQDYTIMDTVLSAPRSSYPDIVKLTEKNVQSGNLNDLKVVPGYYTVATDRGVC